MNTGKWKQRFQSIKGKLRFLSPDDEEDLESLPEEEKSETAEETAAEEPEPSFEDRLKRQRRIRWIRRIVVVVLILAAVIGFSVYNRLHTFQDYMITKSTENSMTSGTHYEEAGKYLYRYNTDGVSCVTRNDEVKWSVTYSMQAPITDICDTTMVIAEQQDTQIYVVNEDGLLGNFDCLLPVLKVRVSKQGVVAAVLQDDDVTWVNLYELDGTTIASDKTTVTDSGYPMDIDLSPDGENMVVSYMNINEGVMTSDVVFYNFGSAGDARDDHVVNSESFEGAVVPEVYFADNSTAVAVADNGFTVFKGGNTPKKSAECRFEDELVSSFHDNRRIGFLFDNEDGDTDYRLEFYTYGGRQTVSEEIDADFEEIRLQNGRLLMSTASSCTVYSTDGRLRFLSSYEKEVVDFFYFSEYRRYLVITSDSFDNIRIC